MSIEEEVKAAIEEFGDRAFERFNYRTHYENGGVSPWYSAISNKFIADNIKKTEILLKPMPKLFAHDVEVYGDNAYLMWQWQYKNNSTGKWADEWFDCDRPLTFKSALNYRRKKTASLPFDLERAKSGDMVEWINADGEIENIWHGDLYLFNGKESELRMKFPPKVQL